MRDSGIVIPVRRDEAGILVRLVGEYRLDDYLQNSLTAAKNSQGDILLHLSLEQAQSLLDLASAILSEHGFDKDWVPNMVGRVCERLIDTLSQELYRDAN